LILLIFQLCFAGVKVSQVPSLYLKKSLCFANNSCEGINFIGIAIFLPKTMARTIRDKLDGIVTYWTFRHISNAKMEGFNNKIRWLIKQAYGFRDREYNKIENLSTAGNFKR